LVGFSTLVEGLSGANFSLLFCVAPTIQITSSGYLSTPINMFATMFFTMLPKLCHQESLLVWNPSCHSVLIFSPKFDPISAAHLANRLHISKHLPVSSVQYAHYSSDQTLKPFFKLFGVFDDRPQNPMPAKPHRQSHCLPERSNQKRGQYGGGEPSSSARTTAKNGTCEKVGCTVDFFKKALLRLPKWLQALDSIPFLYQY